MSQRSRQALDAILADLSVDRIRSDVERITEELPSRLAGSENGRRMAEYSLAGLREAGVEARIDEFPGLVSFPHESSVELLTPEGGRLAAHTLGHSESTAPEGLAAEVIYVGSGSRADYRGQDARGKITLSELSYHPARQEKQRIAAEEGSVGCIMMNWGHPENEAVPFGSIKAAWGTPTPDSFASEMPVLPCVGIARSAGLRLRELIERGPVRVRMHARADNVWRSVQNTIGEIGSGKRELVVAGGHQDSWFGPQATDNASGSSCLLELARAFSRHRDLLDRDLLFAFWTGHETGTMIGSTRFVDRNWRRLRSQAVAYLQIDQPSCAGTTEWSTASNIQLRRFHQEVERAALGNRAQRWRASAKVGDASFVGLGVPMFVGQGAFTPEELAETALASYGWWHHSIENTLDKIDWDYMAVHIRIYAEYLYRLCTLPILPFEFVSMVEGLQERLRALAGLGCGLVLSGPLERVAELAEAVGRLDRVAEAWRARYQAGAADREPAQRLNACMRRLNQLLLPLQSTIKGAYGHDPYGYTPQATLIPSLYGLSELAALPRESPNYWMLETEMVRAVNRVEDALDDACRSIREGLEGITE